MDTGPQAASLDGFFKHSPEMLFLADSGGALLRASDALHRALGSAPSAATSFLDLAHPDDRAALKAQWDRLAEEGGAEIDGVEAQLRLADGSFQTFAFRARYVSGSGASGASEVVGSIKAKEPGAIQEERSTRLLEAITKNLHIAVWEMDREGICTYHAGKGVERSGLKQGELVGKNFYEVFPDHRGENSDLRRALRGEANSDVSETLGVIWESWLFPVRGGRGEVLGVAGVGLDVTEAKRAERELLARLDLIERQKEAIQALSVPIIQVWDSVLTVPLVGMVDSMRAATLIEELLREVVRTRARFAILDLTGVEAMDTSTASHMLRMIAALRLLGAEGILTGIRPGIAHTMVGLGIEMESVTTLANLRAGLRFCMDQMDPDADD